MGHTSGGANGVRRAPTRLHPFIAREITLLRIWPVVVHMWGELEANLLRKLEPD